MRDVVSRVVHVVVIHRADCKRERSRLAGYLCESLVEALRDFAAFRCQHAFQLGFHVRRQLVYVDERQYAKQDDRDDHDAYHKEHLNAFCHKKYISIAYDISF